MNSSIRYQYIDTVFAAEVTMRKLSRVAAEFGSRYVSIHEIGLFITGNPGLERRWLNVYHFSGSNYLCNIAKHLVYK